MFEHRAGKANVKRPLREWQGLIGLYLDEPGLWKDRLEYGAILARDHGDLVAIGIPALKEIRIGKAGIRRYATIEKPLVRVDTSERNKALIHSSPRPERYPGHETTEGAMRVKVIDGYRHGMLADVPKSEERRD